MVHSLTRAAILYRLNEPLVIEELSVPELLPGQVLVRMAFSGVCHTQLLEARGKRGPDAFLPHALGHEASGRVIATGEGVTRVKAGDSVALSWIPGSGREAPGPKYRARSGGIVNAGAIATFAQLAVVAENRCSPLLGLLPLDAAAVLGCAVATGMGTVFNHMESVEGKHVVILGVGGIGLSAIWAARLAGADRVIALDLRPGALHLARQLGASDALDISEAGVEARVIELTGGGAHYAVDASGAVTAMESAFRLVRARGGKAIIAGNPPVGESFRIDPYGLIRGKRIEGTVGGGCRPERDFAVYEKLLVEKKFPFSSFLGRSYSLDEINEALDELERGTTGRLLIRFGEN